MTKEEYETLLRWKSLGAEVGPLSEYLPKLVEFTFINADYMKQEPKIHSDISNSNTIMNECSPLPDNHPLVSEKIYCKTCVIQVYDGTCRENDTTWVETGNGNYCLKCFYECALERNLSDSSKKQIDAFGLDLSRFGFGL
jgi:hypothetical protein